MRDKVVEIGLLVRFKLRDVAGRSENIILLQYLRVAFELAVQERSGSADPGGAGSLSKSRFIRQIGYQARVLKFI